MLRNTLCFPAKSWMKGLFTRCNLYSKYKTKNVTTDFPTNRPQYVELKDCVSDVVACSTEAPQGTVLSPFLVTLYTLDLHNTMNSHLQKFSDETAIVGCVSEGKEEEYEGVISNFINRC